MGKKIIFGLIGAGGIGKEHAKVLSSNPDSLLNWIADVNLSVAEKAAEDCNVKNVTGDYHDIMEDSEVQAVVIATPPWLHYEMTMAGINAGKHVLCEKPLAHTPDAADEMVRAAREEGVVLADCSARHSRLNPKFSAVHKLVSEGKLGRIYLIKHYGRSRKGRGGIDNNFEAKWFLDKSKAVGGALADWGVYDLSFIFGLFDDEVDMLDARGFVFRGIDEANPGTDVWDVEEHGGGWLRLSNSVTVLYERASACHMKEGSVMQIFGSRGGISFEPWSWMTSEISFFHDDLSGNPAEEIISVPGMKEHGEDHPHIDNDLVDALINDRPPAMPGSVAAKILRVIDKLYKSAGVAGEV